MGSKRNCRQGSSSIQETLFEGSKWVLPYSPLGLEIEPLIHSLMFKTASLCSPGLLQIHHHPASTSWVIRCRNVSVHWPWQILIFIVSILYSILNLWAQTCRWNIFFSWFVLLFIKKFPKLCLSRTGSHIELWTEAGLTPVFRILISDSVHCQCDRL